VNQQPLITTTEAVDTVLYVIFGISGVALLGITVAMVYLVWRYNRKREPVPISQKDHNIWLEITWTVIPTILVGVMFWYGWEGYLSLRRVPDNAIPVQGSARMWSWLFTYENGKTSDKLYVPVGQPVNVKLIAEDVLHAFYVPAFRVKRDCVPGMETYVWFVAEEPGSYDLFCAEYCGVAHSEMITTVEAIPPAEFAAWLEEKPVVTDAGRSLLQKQGCLGCHSLDGSASVGPTLQGISGRQVTVITDGENRTLISDRGYLQRAILKPGADIVDGFPPAMPSYEGRFEAEEMSEILDYLESLSDSETQTEPEESTEPASVEADEGNRKAADPANPGQSLADQNGCLNCHSTDGSRLTGPSFKGLLGSERSVTRDGQTSTIKADSEYLTRAIREPGAEISEGYPNAMPPYSHLSDGDIRALEAWLETLK
jgi:cytochrome c oxidase subunit 2